MEVTGILGLFGVRLVGTSYADAVIGEVVVHFGDVDFWHVAGRAVFRADRTCGPRVVGGFGSRGRCYVAA
jgi:hypothetical protein